MPKTTITAATLAKVRKESVAGAKQADIADVQAPGLVLRVQATGAVWQFRFEMHGRSSRLTLGSVDEWTIAEARDLVSEARKLIRGRIRRPDDEWVHEQRVAGGKTAAAPVAAVHRQSTYWTYKQAVTAYLAMIKKTRSKDTHRDYKQTLGNADLAALSKRPVPSITRADVSKIVADVHASGREPTAEGMVRKLKPFWRWLAADGQVDKSGVVEGVMVGLRAPERSRLTEEEYEQAAVKRYVPPMHEVGRVLAIARSGALDPIVACAIELMVFAPQRRRAVATARRDKMRPISATEGLWRVPPFHRKTALMRGDYGELVIPLPAPAWAAVQRALDLGDETDEKRVFFQRRAARAGDELDHIAPDSLTHTMSYMPGVIASPHDLRRAIGTHGEEQLGYSETDIKRVLDHSKGKAAGDVTSTSYALSDGTHYTWKIMRAWADLVEAAYREEIKRDDRLLDRAWIARMMYESRERSKGRGKKVDLTKRTPANMWSETEA